MDYTYSSIMPYYNVLGELRIITNCDPASINRQK